MPRTLALLVLLAFACPLLMNEASAQSARAPRIVSLAPNLTELAFAAGAGEQLVATVEYSDYPAAARKIPRIGDAFRVDLERLVTLHPDLVLAWETGTPVALIERARALDLHVLVIPVGTLAEIARALRVIGKAAGTTQQAELAAQAFESQIAQLRSTYAGRPPVSSFVEVNWQPLYTVNGKHVITEVLGICGGTNVFASLNDISPVIDIEAVAQRQPRVILAAADDSATPVLTRWSHWSFLEAVRRQNVYAIPSDELVRATPRLVQGAKRICEVLDRVRQRDANAASR